MRELVLTESTLAFAGLGAVPMNWMTVLPAYGCIAQGSCPSLVASNLTRRGTVGPFLSKTIHLIAFLERKNARVDTVCFWLWSSIVSQRSTALLKERWSHCKVPTPLFREFPKLFVFFFSNYTITHTSFNSCQSTHCQLNKESWKETRYHV